MSPPWRQRNGSAPRLPMYPMSMCACVMYFVNVRSPLSGRGRDEPDLLSSAARVPVRLSRGQAGERSS